MVPGVVPWLQQGRERTGHRESGPGWIQGQGLGPWPISLETVPSAEGPWAPNVRTPSADNLRPSHAAGEGGQDLQETIYHLTFLLIQAHVGNFLASTQPPRAGRFSVSSQQHRGDAQRNLTAVNSQPASPTPTLPDSWSRGLVGRGLLLSFPGWGGGALKTPEYSPLGAVTGVWWV